MIGLPRGVDVYIYDEPCDMRRSCPDNNATERVIRGVVVGRKPHYGSRSERGTQVAALFYSLVDSAELAGVTPHEYLRIAVDAALDGEPIPLPHELVERLAVPPVSAD